MLREFDNEEITVSSVVKILTIATYAPADAPGAKKAIVQVLNASISFYLNGDTPSSASGFNESAGSSFELNEAEMVGFRAIRRSGSDAKLVISYLREM